MRSKGHQALGLVIALCALTAGAACKGKSPTSPTGVAGSTPSITQVGIAAQGIAIDGQYTMNVGDRLQVAAMVTMSDGAREDRTATAVWESDNASVVTVSAGLITAVGAGQALVTARFDSVLARLAVTVRGGGGGDGSGGGGGGGGDRALVRLEIEGSPSVAVGRAAPLAAVAHYSDGSREGVTTAAAWSVAPSSLASISGGQLHGIQPGTITVTAGYQGMTASMTSQVAATSASIVSVAVSGSLNVAAGGTSQLAATATLSDGSQQAVTTLAQWESSQPGTATVAGGLVRGVSGGSAVITARVDGVAGQATVQVSAGPGNGTPTLTGLSLQGGGTVTVGQSTQLTATALFSDGSQQDVTAGATWTSSAASATVSGGRVTGVSEGTATITATHQGQSASAQVTVTVTPISVVSISLTGTLSVHVGLSTQLTVIATMSNGTTIDVTGQASYASSQPLLASVSASGRVTGLLAGLTQISASYQGVSAQVQVQITLPTPIVNSLTINGPSSVRVLQLLTLSAVATMSDGSEQTVTDACTWSSSSLSILDLLGKGLLRGLLVGNVTVTATHQGKTAQKAVQVTLF